MPIVNEEKIGTNGQDSLVNDKTGYTKLTGLKGNDTYIINDITNSFTELDAADSIDEDY